MQWVLYKLKKLLDNEKLWLTCTAHDAKSKAGKKMAQERVPQLKQAIEILSGERKPTSKNRTRKTLTTKQLDLWNKSE